MSLRAFAQSRPLGVCPTVSLALLASSLPEQQPVSLLFATLTDDPHRAENKATLSPLPAALTRRAGLKSLVCHSYEKTAGRGTSRRHSPLPLHLQPQESTSTPLPSMCASFVFILLRTLLHCRKSYLSCFQALPHSLAKTPGVGVARHSPLGTRHFL
jgi:hypothetical protein